MLTVIKGFAISPYACILLLVFSSCGAPRYETVNHSEAPPAISPDYDGVTIPCNIAPMNFAIKEEGDFFRIEVSSPDGTRFNLNTRNGNVRFPERRWRNMIENSAGGTIIMEVFAYSGEDRSQTRYKPIEMHVAEDPIDPYIVYRLIHPGYYSWYRMKIVQRSTETFNEKPIAENQLLDHNCVNCHSFSQNDPQTMLLHVRGSRGGTYFSVGDKLQKMDLRIDGMPANATYPAWHPGGRFVSFSVNNVRQSFYARSTNNIEVFDTESTLVNYDFENNILYELPESDPIRYMQTFPCWSPDGKFLYYSQSVKPDFEIDAEKVREIGYDIVRRPFDSESGAFGEPELIFDATSLNKSASFAKVSPEGKHMVFTLHDYGTFPVWSSEANLYIVDLQSGESTKLNIGSDDTESYHGWSSNGKWLVFSSKRKDGVSSRPYFSYFGTPGNPGKPFVLPQEDPGLYEKVLHSYNLPELIRGEVIFSPGDFESASKTDAIKAVPGGVAGNQKE